MARTAIINPNEPAARDTFVVGDSVVIDFDVYVNGTLTAPTTVTATVETPITAMAWDSEDEEMDITGGVDTDATVHSDTAGLYGIVYVPTVAGWHRFKIVGTGTAPFVREGTFYVQATTIG